MLKKIITVVLAITLTGCATDPAPNFFNGNYYMAGDKNCVSIRPLSSTRVMCMDKDGVDNGYRDAMTYEQLQMYQLQSLNQQAQLEQTNQQLQQTGQTFQNSGQQILQQSQSYSAPQVQPINPYGSSGGATYRRVGNTIIGSDGRTCQIVGQNVICN